MAERDRAQKVVEMVREIEKRAVQHSRQEAACRGVSFEDCDGLCGGVNVYSALASWVDQPDAVIAEIGLLEYETVDG